MVNEMISWYRVYLSDLVLNWNAAVCYFFVQTSAELHQLSFQILTRHFLSVSVFHVLQQIESMFGTLFEVITGILWLNFTHFNDTMLYFIGILEYQIDTEYKYAHIKTFLITKQWRCCCWVRRETEQMPALTRIRVVSMDASVGLHNMLLFFYWCLKSLWTLNDEVLMWL